MKKRTKTEEILMRLWKGFGQIMTRFLAETGSEVAFGQIMMRFLARTSSEGTFGQIITRFLARTGSEGTFVQILTRFLAETGSEVALGHKWRQRHSGIEFAIAKMSRKRRIFDKTKPTLMRFLLPIIILALVAILPDFYITRAFLKDSPVWVRLLQWVPTVLFFCGIAGLQIGGAESNAAMKIFFAVILCFMLPKLLFTVISLFGRLIHLQGAFNAAGVTIGGLFLICAAYGLTIGWKNPVVKDVELHFENLPEAFDGYTIIHISDWHLGTYRPHPQTILKEIELANKAEADAIVFTGDIVNGNPIELEPFREMLSSLKAKDGVFSIMGNHDYCMYGSDHTPEGIQRNIEALQNLERSFGWNLLLNDNRLITRGADTLAIVGVENDGTPPFPQYADMDKALSRTDGAAFKVLLSHDPTHWRRSVLPDTDIDLTLSGHTHAMQFKVLGFSPSRIAYKEWGGLYEEGQRKLYVSTGSGGNVAFRFGAWPEIIRITLRKQ